MLFLTRKIGQSIIINDEITVTVMEINGKTAKLGFLFPENVKVLRQEIYEKIQQENKTAAEDALAIHQLLELNHPNDGKKDAGTI